MAEQKKKRDVKTIVMRVIAVILLLVGLALIFNKQIRNHLITQNQTQAMTSLTRKEIEKNQKKKGMFNFSKVKEVDFGQVAKSRTKNGAHVIGALAIPDVNMHLPILLGMSDDAMATGGGTMRPDQKMGKGNYPLAGHYMTSKGILFSPLEDTKKGQLVYLTNLKKVFVYKIYMKKVVNPYAVYLVNNTKKPIVTLITCADGGTNRWAVRGKLIKTEKATADNIKVFNLK
ncbi:MULTISPECIES: class A sortase [Lactobacillus]|uniref:Class A sortase n=1 Tax=Lactobacillus xujianguonis TaxID=2495899 RepID=A0A437SXU1_9LACO|nr:MULTISPECIES: class A sortase [Lactobacillus]RVU71690.1 class A sortase [Lactobacillus xujianguonis]RVU77795.1 class A sortase [Lactobacillus xujianguonis]